MSTVMNFSLEGNLKQTVLYTYSTIMNFILEGKLCFTETKRLCRITLPPTPKYHSPFQIKVKVDIKTKEGTK